MAVRILQLEFRTSDLVGKATMALWTVLFVRHESCFSDKGDHDSTEYGRIAKRLEGKMLWGGRNHFFLLPKGPDLSERKRRFVSIFCWRQPCRVAIDEGNS